MITTDNHGEKWRVSAPDSLMPELIDAVIFCGKLINWQEYRRRLYVAGNGKQYKATFQGHNVTLEAA